METKEIALNRSVLLSYPYLVPTLAFAIPFLVSGPQLLTGSLVNFFLFLSAARYSGKNQVAVAIGPSVGALLNGVVFGKFTPFLAYFLPFIWIGNLILIRSFLSLKNNSSLMRVLLPSLFKSAFLFAFAFIFFKIGLVPKIFLTAMGVFQFVTAIFGGLLFAFSTWQVKKGLLLSSKK